MFSEGAIEGIFREGNRGCSQGAMRVFSGSNGVFSEGAIEGVFRGGN